jgi:hypothetical protein
VDFWKFEFWPLETVGNLNFSKKKNPQFLDASRQKRNISTQPESLFLK